MVSQKFAIELVALPAIIPALRLGSGQDPGGIQNPHCISPFAKGETKRGSIPGRALAIADLPGMTLELCNDLLIQDTSLTL